MVLGMNLVHVVNPGATGFQIADVEALYASVPPGVHLVVDLGGPHLVPLEEVLAVTLYDDPLAELAMLDEPGWAARL
jgi:hypothetical protein